MTAKKSSFLGRFTDLPSGITCFISYSFQDGLDYAMALKDILTAHGVDVFLGDDQLSIGEQWVDIIQNKLQQAHILIFMATPASLKAEYARSEIAYFYRSGRITIPIIFRGVTTPNDLPMELQLVTPLVEDESALRKGPSKQGAQRLLEAIANFAPSIDKRKPTRPRSQEKRPLNEGKLILVGRGEVGKTSLVRRLVGKRFRGDESKTQGINITTWPLRCPTDTFRLNIWDFGGQEIMHATHQFFLTERSLYLLVLNGREGGEDLDAEYWLKHIESFGGDSPVIVVQNKITQHPFELNYRGLQARYPQIRGFVKTDCKDAIGLDELRLAIQQVVGGMPEVRMQFPLDWFKVKERLESMGDEYMGYEGFRQLCYEEGIEDEPDRDTLCWVLHCLGIALNYRDDPRLRETSVLKPEWVTHGIYNILNAKKLAERQGELHLNDLQQLLPKNRYPANKHLFLLELMRKFSLCFAFPDEVDRYLIPELLGKEEPEETVRR